MNRIWAMAFLLLSTVSLGQNDGVIGNWKDPMGSTIQIYRCGANVCARVIGIRPNAPGHLDMHNPNPALRNRSLCGLQIGWNFHLARAGRAEGGELYDPESGRTYSGSMTPDGNKLKLRGYIGFEVFGRTETWTRAQNDFVPCHP